MSSTRSTEENPGTARGGLRRWIRWPFSLTAIWLMLPLCVLARATLIPTPPHDYWWPIVQGRALEQLGHIPTQNLYLYTLPADAPFMNQPWLAQWSMWKVAESFGHEALVWLNVLLLLIAVAVSLEVATRREHAPKVLGILGAFGSIMFSAGVMVRTRMFACPLWVCVLGVSMLVAEGRLRWRWMLAPALAAGLWANVHGTFLFAVLLVGAVGVGDLLDRVLEARDPRVLWGEHRGRVMRWGLAVGGVALATLLNPHGIDVWIYAFSLSSKMSSGNVTEWESMDLDPAGIFLYVSVFAFVLLGLWQWRKIGWRALVPWLGLSILAATTARGVVWWGLSLTFCFAPLTAMSPVLADEDEEEIPAIASGINLGLVMLLIASIVSLLPGLPGHSLLTTKEGPKTGDDFLHYPGYRTMDRHHPLRIIGELEREGYPGNLFHSQEIGGLLEFMLAKEKPAQVVFADQRFGMTPDQLWIDYFIIVDAEEGWSALLEKYGVETVLIDTEVAGALSAELENSPAWTRVDEELSYLLFKRAR